KAWRTHFAEGGEPLPVDAVEQHNASAYPLPLVDRFQSAGCSELFGTHRHFTIARFDLVHAAFEDDPATIDERDIGQYVLNFFDLMGGEQDRAAAVEVIR